MPTANPHAWCLFLFLFVCFVCTASVSPLKWAPFILEQAVMLSPTWRFHVLRDQDGYDEGVHGDDTRHDDGYETLVAVSKASAANTRTATSIPPSLSDPDGR